MNYLADIKQSSMYLFLKKNYKEIKQKRFCHEAILKSKTNKPIDELFVTASEELQHYLEKMLTRDIRGRFSESSKEKTIYAYVYIVLLAELLNVDLPLDIKQEISKILLDSQRKDGLFYDVNAINLAYVNGDGWGARHLVPHIIIAFQILGITPKYDFTYLHYLHDYRIAYKMMESLDWNHPWTTSNYVMNVCVALQYERDYLQVDSASEGVRAIQDWLLDNVNETTGMWHKGDAKRKSVRYEAVRGAYHLYPLLIYDNVSIPHIEKAIDIILSTQNKNGGFDMRFNSSACEDIDAVEPLIRLSLMAKHEYRRAEVKNALEKAFLWIYANQMKDGGFVFRMGERFDYGHRNIVSGINESNLFASWFRYLCMCYIHEYLTGNEREYVDIPGYEISLKKRVKDEIK